METIDRSRDIECTVNYPARVCSASGDTAVVSGDVQVEHVLDVIVDGMLSMRIVCTPTNLVELVVGRLFTEGMIASPGDIETVYLCEHSTQARVLLSRKHAGIAPVAMRTVPSCCTGNRVYAAIDQAGDEGTALSPVVPLNWNPQWIFDLANLFAQDTPMHRTTLGTHSCFLSCEGEILYCCEDLGRHNAFDKVIGCALRDGIALDRCTIYTSGRLPVDMVTKAIRAGIPILASKAVPTDLTIELARTFDLTLICAARPDSMMVYNDPTHPIAQV